MAFSRRAVTPFLSRRLRNFRGYMLMVAGERVAVRLDIHRKDSWMVGESWQAPAIKASAGAPASNPL